jgi:hypothetical protein
MLSRISTGFHLAATSVIGRRCQKLTAQSHQQQRFYFCFVDPEAKDFKQAFSTVLRIADNAAGDENPGEKTVSC